MSSWIKKGIGVAVAACFGAIATNYFKNSQLLMPSEYKEIKSIVNELAEHNDLGDRQITFTVVPGHLVGWAAEDLKLCKEDFCGFYDDLDPYKKFKGDKAYEINEAIRQAYLFDYVQGISKSHGTISLTRATFRTFNSRREYLGCVIAHEITHFLEDHIFENDKYVSENKKRLSEAQIEDLENELSRASEIEAHNQASLMMKNAGYPIESCLEELKFTSRLGGDGANTEPDDSHPGYQEWVSELEKFIVTQKDVIQEDTFETPISWQYDRDLNILVMIPTAQK